MRTLFLMLLILLAGFAQGQSVEVLEYSLKYSFLKGGEARITISDTTFSGKQAKHYHLRGQTVGFAEALYNIDDVYETILDPRSMQPIKHIRNIKERKYRYYNETLFYPANDSVVSLRSGGRKVPHNMLDILTVYGYLRQNKLLENLKIGDQFTLPVYHADKYFMMTTVFLGIEKIKSKLGEKECYVISPRVDQGKVLKSSDGLKFYITKDADKIPVVLELDLTVGAVRAELTSYQKTNGKTN
ncbi:MAG: DUF3108 domain-containing protein [Mangrovibacterium sp.]